MDKTESESLAEEILTIIRKRAGHHFKAKEIADRVNRPEDEIIAAVDLLKNWGYDIKVDNDRRYIFRGAPDKFLDTEIRHQLKTRLLGNKIHAYNSIGSTNVIANQLAVSGEPEGSLVVADQQTKGRGRFRRVWHSPKDVGLYCSLVLRPKIHPSEAPGISLVTALATADTIKAFCDSEVKIKWPNDVLISGRKAAGILTELSAEPDLVNFVIVGIGVNINHKKTDLPAELRKQATSIRIESGKSVKRVEFLRRLLYQFEKEYLSFQKHGLAKLRKRLVDYSSLIGHQVTIRTGKRKVSGKAVDIDRQGLLIVETDEGRRAFSAGEVTTR